MMAPPQTSMVAPNSFQQLQEPPQPMQFGGPSPLMGQMLLPSAPLSAQMAPSGPMMTIGQQPQPEAFLQQQQQQPPELQTSQWRQSSWAALPTTPQQNQAA